MVVDSATGLALEVAKKTEALILEQLNDFISRGLIIVEMGPISFVQDARGGNTVELQQTCKLVLKDKEYIEKIEKENKELKELIAKLRAAM